MHQPGGEAGEPGRSLSSSSSSGGGGGGGFGAGVDEPSPPPTRELKMGSASERAARRKQKSTAAASRRRRNGRGAQTRRTGRREGGPEKRRRGTRLAALHEPAAPCSKLGKPSEERLGSRRRGHLDRSGASCWLTNAEPAPTAGNATNQPTPKQQQKPTLSDVPIASRSQATAQPEKAPICVLTIQCSSGMPSRIDKSLLRRAIKN